MSIKAKNKFHNIMCEFLSVTILCIMIISLFFYPAVFQGKIIYQEDPGGTDTFDLHVARRYLAVQCIKQYGEFPLWEPKIACGAPLFAESEIGLFYPSFIFFFLNNLTLATNLTVFSALLIAMLGSYAWSRSLGLEQLASGVAAISFGLGEVFLLRTGALNIIHVIAWLPFSLSVIHLMAQHSQKRYWCLLVSIWTLQLLAGHFQMFAICLFLCMLYCIYDTFFVCQKQFRFRFITCTFLALCYAAALGSIQLLPTYEFTRQSERVHIPLELAEIQMSSPKWENIIKLVSPFYVKSDIKLTRYTTLIVSRDSFHYIGIIPFCLLFLSLRKSSITVFLWLTAIILFVISLGPDYGLYYLLWKYVPFFHTFRYIGRFAVPMSCVLAVMAAMGAQRLADFCSVRFNNSTARIILAVLLLGSLIDLGRVNRVIQNYVAPEWSVIPASAGAIGPDQRVYSPYSSYYWRAALDKTNSNNHAAVIQHCSVLSPGSACLWNVTTFDDYVAHNKGIALYDSYLMQSAVSRLILEVLPRINTNEKQLCCSKIYEWLRILSVNYIVTQSPISTSWPKELLKSVKTIGTSDYDQVYVYSVPKSVDRVRIVPSLIKGMPNNSISLYKVCEINDSDSLYEPDLSNPQSIGTVRTAASTNNTLSLVVNSPNDAFIVINNTYDTNWHAFVDGRETAVRRTNMSMQSLPVPAGEHSVELRYLSPAFALGWRISAAALAVFAAAVGVLSIFSYRRLRHSRNVESK